MRGRDWRREIAKNNISRRERLLRHITPGYLRYFTDSNYKTSKLKKGVYFCSCSMCKPKRFTGNSLDKWTRNFKSRKYKEKQKVNLESLMVITNLECLSCGFEWEHNSKDLWGLPEDLAEEVEVDMLKCLNCRKEVF